MGFSKNGLFNLSRLWGKPDYPRRIYLLASRQSIKLSPAELRPAYRLQRVSSESTNPARSGDQKSHLRSAASKAAQSSIMSGNAPCS